MNVDRVIVHFLRKEEKQQKAELDRSQRLLPVDPRSIFLVEKLDDAYRNAAVTNAVFDGAAKSSFPTQFKTYYRTRSDAAFIEFSQATLEELKTRVEKIPQAKGGFLVFAEYQHLWESCISVFLIRDTSGMLFKKELPTASYAISPVEHLDLDRLAMACKVNLHKYRPVQGRYLSYIKRNMEVISRYFVDWIGATGTEAGSVYTANLISVVDGLPEEELPVEDGKPVPRAELKKRVYDYVKATTGRVVNVQQLSEDIFEPKVLEEVKPTSGGIVNLNRLSQVLYGKDKGSTLVDAADRQGIEIDTEFQVDTKELRKLVRIEVEADDVLLRFSPRDKERKVRLDGDRVIIDSKEFARKYRQELGIDGAS